MNAGSILRALWIVAGLLAPTACAPVDLLNATIPTGDLTITRDVAYGTDARQRLDIYAPKSRSGALPVIIFFHGGAWQSGDRADYLFAAAAFAAKGAVVAIPDYRVYPTVTFPGFLADSAQATAWVHQNIGRWGGDRRNIFLIGHSAGAYNAVMLALDEEYLENAGLSTEDIAGAVGISGPYDFLPLTRPDVKPIFEVVSDMSLTQPIRFARRDAPPLLLLTGTADITVGPYNTLNLSERMHAVGGSVEEHLYPGIAHLGSVLALAPAFRWRASILDDIESFIRRHER
ncbi:MAG TPA: alpha/beta hydrolase [Alphaproteobacteria bacterium]|nr:alpha/beta hydrolase [Alphaproteobacteria bacterium]